MKKKSNYQRLHPCLALLRCFPKCFRSSADLCAQNLAHHTSRDSAVQELPIFRPRERWNSPAFCMGQADQALLTNGISKGREFKDLFLAQMTSQCRATSWKVAGRSLHVAIQIVASDKSRATCRLSRLTEHKQRNTCVANNVVVAVACRESRVARNWTRLNWTRL